MAIVISGIAPLEPFGPNDPLTMRIEFSNGLKRDLRLRDNKGNGMDLDELARLCSACNRPVISDTDQLIGCIVAPWYWNERI